MTRSYQTRTVPIDSAALDRLEHYVVEEGIYGSKEEAYTDNYEEAIDHLLDEDDEDDS